MNYAKFGEAMALTDKQLVEAVNTHMELIEPEDILEMIESAIAEIEKADPGNVLESANPAEKQILLSMHLYQNGFMTGLYMLNMAFIENLAEMQNRKDEREDKRKGVSSNAEA